MQLISLLLLLLGALGYCVAAPRGYYYGSYYPQRRAPPSIYNYNNAQQQSSRFSRSQSSSSSRQADKENAKFAGAANQELDELSSDVGDDRSLLLKKKLKRLYRPLYSGYGGPCSPFGRDAAGGRKDEVEQGRFLFDVNVYNVYGGSNGCRGYSGLGGLGGFGGLGGLGGLGGGLLSDPIAPVAPIRPLAPLATWLSLFAPGILQNSLAATVPARPYADPLPARPAPAAGDLQSDPAVDPNYNPVPVRRPVPNRVYYDSAGAPPLTPGALTAGVSTTINGIIQQLTGQVQPVYQTGTYRSTNQRSSYG
ncbi:uncharacterized protein LOC6563378 [Drosophila grimshawi]|uniref:GH18095 n=1 Tax=Drosophila grimshawi TaxID=7222 RepID=B4JH88_DROGR|nr:uncharacterized protein LOC6563378 [Drosophila grimshawi]EDV93795.1 GH18095 [Drosophila grimshawi]